MVRFLFVGHNRIPDSILTLKFDHYLCPQPVHTYIHFDAIDPDVDLLKIYQSNGIDTTNFTVVTDHDFVKKYPNINFNLINGWIKQQLLKLAAVDLSNYSTMLIQDCDTFLLEPYHWIVNNTPGYLALANTTHSPQFYKYIKKFTGRKRSTEHCFITEFMPVFKKDWVVLKQRIEDEYQCSWMTALLQLFERDSKNGTKFVWFSEYELLGNFGLSQHPTAEINFQKRLSIYNDDTACKVWLEHPSYVKLDEFFSVPNLKDYNSVCIKSPTTIDYSDVDPVYEFVCSNIK